METIQLPCYGIKLQINRNKREGTIVTDFDENNNEIEILTSMILACACSGVDVKSPSFIEAIETTVDAIVNM